MSELDLIALRCLLKKLFRSDAQKTRLRLDIPHCILNVTERLYYDTVPLTGLVQEPTSQVEKAREREKGEQLENLGKHVITLQYY